MNKQDQFLYIRLARLEYQIHALIDGDRELAKQYNDWPENELVRNAERPTNSNQG